MIKCPNCGSTAQVRLILVKYDRDEYKCGCGCRFFRKAFTEKVIKIFPERE
jgi:hypothetical protein